MEMDLILAVAYQRHPDRSSNDLRALLDSLTEDEATRIFESVEQEAYEFVRPDSDESVLEYVREYITGALDVLSGDYLSRSIFVIRDLDDRYIALGGGDSWGDTPDGLSEIAYLEEWGEW